MAAAQQLPEDIIRQSFDQHKHWPGFVAALFQNQKDLPADLIDQAYHDYDRSFESILANSFAAADNLDDSVIYALERILPSGGMAVDLSNMRLIRVGQTDGRTGEIPGVIIDQALQESRNFMGVCRRLANPKPTRRRNNPLGFIAIWATSRRLP